MRPLTLVLPYYRNAGMLAEQVRAWNAFPEALRALLHVIVVDDGSPVDPAEKDVLAGAQTASARLYRNEVDIRWNWLFCRNLGVQEATTDWVLLTDIDHVLLESTLRFLTHEDLASDVVYRFSRVDAPNLTPYKPHPNSWFLTRGMFETIGGYDERFSGYYGSDADFRERVQTTATAVVMLNQPLIRYPREVIPDASTTTYGRKEPQDLEGIKRVRAARDLIPDWRPLRVTCPWTRLV